MFRSLTAKVALGAGCLFLLLASCALIVIMALSVSGEVTEHVAEHMLNRESLNSQFALHLSRAMMETQTYARGGQLDDLAESREQLALSEAKLRQLAELLREEEDLEPEVLLLHQELQSHREALFTQTDAAIRAIETAIAGENGIQIDAALTALEALEESFDILTGNMASVQMRDATVARATVEEGLQQGRLGVISIFGALMISILLGLWYLQSRIVQPLRQLASANQQIQAGNLMTAIPVTHRDEIGDLQRSFNQMVRNLAEQRADLQARQFALERALADIQQQKQLKEQLLDELDEQREVLRELSVPILPLTKETLVMPLVGALDSARLVQVQERALQSLERSDARALILDVTGVPMIDSQVAQGLLTVVEAARLLGATTTLVGIRPEVAQTIVGLGLNLNGIRAYGDLRSALLSKAVGGRT